MLVWSFLLWSKRITGATASHWHTWEVKGDKCSGASHGRVPHHSLLPHATTTANHPFSDIGGECCLMMCQKAPELFHAAASGNCPSLYSEEPGALQVHVPPFFILFPHCTYHHTSFLLLLEGTTGPLLLIAQLTERNRKQSCNCTFFPQLWTFFKLGKNVIDLLQSIVRARYSPGSWKYIWGTLLNPEGPFIYYGWSFGRPAILELFTHNDQIQFLEGTCFLLFSMVRIAD